MSIVVEGNPLFETRQSFEVPGDQETPDFARYNHPIDRGVAGFESAPGRSTPVPLAFHEAFKQRRGMSTKDRRELEIKQVALRIAAGLEFRSLRELAAELDCTHTAIDNMLARLCERLGMRKFHVSDTTRERQRAARRRFLERKAAATQAN